MVSPWFKEAFSKLSHHISINKFNEVEDAYEQKKLLSYILGSSKRYCTLYTGVARITYKLVGEIAKLAYFLELEWLYKQCISVILQK